MPQTDNNGPRNPRQPGEVQLTSELVRKVADRVYELWQQDARIEAERWRLSRSRRKHR